MQFSLTCLLVTSALIGLVGCMKTDALSVKQYVKEEVNVQFPDAKVTDTADYELVIVHAGGTRQVLDLASIQEGCKRLPRSCSSNVSRVMLLMQSGIDGTRAEITLDTIIPIISSRAPTKTTLLQNNPASVFFLPMSDTLSLRLAVANDDALTLLDEATIAKLALKPEELVKYAIRNLESAAQVNVTPFPGEVSVHQVFGRHASAGLLASKHTQAIKTQLKLNAVAVSFPRRGTTLIADADNTKAVARLREISERFLQPASAVISPEVYLVTDAGLAVMRH